MLTLHLMINIKIMLITIATCVHYASSERHLTDVFEYPRMFSTQAKELKITTSVLLKICHTQLLE